MIVNEQGGWKQIYNIIENDAKDFLSFEEGSLPLFRYDSHYQ
jgi:hypothetical protein